MFITGTRAASTPERIAVENYADGHQAVRLTDNIREEATDEGTIYVYDEVYFDVPSDRHVTEEGVADAFDGWWEYGKQEQETITLEQRVSDLEEIILSMMEV